MDVELGAVWNKKGLDAHKVLEVGVNEKGGRWFGVTSRGDDVINTPSAGFELLKDAADACYWWGRGQTIGRYAESPFSVWANRVRRSDDDGKFRIH